MTTTIGRWRWAVAGVVAASVALAALGPGGSPVRAEPQPQGKGKAGRGRTAPQKKAPPNAADPLARGANNPDGNANANAGAEPKPAPPGSYHFRVKIKTFDNVALGASYYPAIKQDTSAPVALLVHEKDRSDKDFEDPIADLKNKGLAESLQAAGYAVLSFDLRGHGSNPRKAPTDKEWREMVDDLQSAYQFLIDRHNRGELNIAKLGVVALGEGANLAAAWAYQPGGAVSSEGRVTDLSGLALVSPLPTGEGYNFSTLMNALAPRIPVLLMAGERDALSHEAVKKVKANVERTRQNKVEVFPSSLHGYKLLRLEPRAATTLTKFLETTVKLRATDWEPRYNLNPITYSDIQVVRHRADEKERDKEKDAPKEKAKDDDKPKDDPEKETEK